MMTIDTTDYVQGFGRTFICISFENFDDYVYWLMRHAV